MFTVKSIRNKRTGVTVGFEAVNYRIIPMTNGDTCVEFWPPVPVDPEGHSVSLFASHVERIVIENERGKTVENVVSLCDVSPPEETIDGAVENALQA